MENIDVQIDHRGCVDRRHRLRFRSLCRPQQQRLAANRGDRFGPHMPAGPECRRVRDGALYGAALPAGKIELMMRMVGPAGFAGPIFITKRILSAHPADCDLNFKIAMCTKCSLPFTALVS
jgi:hypothetical protein